ncbi:MAG: hypothetical protein M1832_001472 [Thelocarpon impressellum]|nr:MAG: hypothetical protein M1832_001472 [Thelocarpon impressellum]
MGALPDPRRCRASRPLAALAAILLLMLWTVPRARDGVRSSLARLKAVDLVAAAVEDGGDAYPSTELTAFWKVFSRALVDADPGAAAIGRDITSPDFLWTDMKPGWTPPDVLQMPWEQLSRLQASHAGFVRRLLAPARSPSALPPLPYRRGSRGIVTSSASGSLQVLVVSIRMLRRTGSALPIEVFLEQADDVVSSACTEVLAALGARCLLLGAVMGRAPLNRPTGSYQVKAFAIAFSSFQHVLWLDADAFPIAPPEQLFDAAVFRRDGLVSWPDFWAVTTSRHFYRVAAVKPPADATARASTESAQLLIDKDRHGATLLLTTYYNHYGLQYYELLSQGARGQGDKETFPAAATALGLPFYQVEQPALAVGHGWAEGHAWDAIVQHHPQEDFDSRHHEDIIPRPFFFHNRGIKADASSLVAAMLRFRTRMWYGAEEMEARFGFDVERAVWDEVLLTACELAREFPAMRNDPGLCGRARMTAECLFAGGACEFGVRG